tara:strand:+ start:321 stop:569 length:249 start_codon:yes stop_codon:yes gene_type:complete
MSELTSDIDWTAMQWEGKNPLWDEVMRTLEEFEEVETQTATGPDAGDQRAYFCGKAAAISEVRVHFKTLRDMAVSRRTGGSD